MYFLEDPADHTACLLLSCDLDLLLRTSHCGLAHNFFFSHSSSTVSWPILLYRSVISSSCSAAILSFLNGFLNPSCICSIPFFFHLWACVGWILYSLKYLAYCFFLPQHFFYLSCFESRTVTFFCYVFHNYILPPYYSYILPHFLSSKWGLVTFSPKTDPNIILVFSV